MAFEWTDATEDSFVQLRSALTTAPVLAYPRFGPGYTFILETDASTVGLGAVLSQVQEDGMVHPIAYASRAVDKHERNYGISELETLGLVWSVCYFRSCLLGHPCVVYTDHAACLSILNTTKPSGKLARWALTIQEMDIVSLERRALLLMLFLIVMRVKMWLQWEQKRFCLQHYTLPKHSEMTLISYLFCPT